MNTIIILALISNLMSFFLGTALGSIKPYWFLNDKGKKKVMEEMYQRTWHTK